MNSTNQKFLIIALFLNIVFFNYGCGGGGSDTTPDTPPEQTNPPSLGEQLTNLESSGAYPKLDRSTDIADPDSDANGIRDDVETYINSLNLPQDQKNAAQQTAKVFQQALLVDPTDTDALRSVSKASADAINCLSQKVSLSSDIARITGVIEAVTANTKERVLAYIKYNEALSGSVVRLPSGNTCTN